MDVMMMPIVRFQNYLKWKIKFDEDVARMKEKALNDNTLK